MDWCLTISFVFVTILTAAFYTFWTKSLPVPKVDVDEYWGRGRKEDHVIDESVRSFHIDYPKERIDELKTKLNEKRTFTPPLEGTALHSYGMDTNKLQVLIKYWRDEYLPKWDDRLKLFNSLPHFKTNIQGYVVCVHTLSMRHSMINYVRSFCFNLFFFLASICISFKPNRKNQMENELCQFYCFTVGLAQCASSTTLFHCCNNKTIS